MGDRAIVVFANGRDYSCGIYLHWDGNPERVSELLEKAKPRMRRGDISYSAARFCGVCHEEISGNLSLGIVPPPLQNKKGGINWGKYSQGDNGVCIVSVRDWSIRWVGQEYIKRATIVETQK